MRTPFPGLRHVVVVTAVLLLAGLAAPAVAAPDLPPVGTDFDYQLGGNRPVPGHVEIVVRDRTAAPLAADSAYNVCYVNGFQTQESQKRFWRRHWSLVLKKDGRAVTDSAWGEWLLDIRTDRKRSKLARIMGRWVSGCADDGYDAVEYDNLDSFTRSKHLLEPADANAYARKLVRKGHAAGLAVAQKNRAGWDGTSVGFDFAIAEECARWHECGSYVDHYGRHVLAVEYRKQDFRRACRHWSDRISVVSRDLALSKHGVRRWC